MLNLFFIFIFSFFHLFSMENLIDTKLKNLEAKRILVVVNIDNLDTIQHKNLSKLIKSLQDKDIHVIGLTQTLSGRHLDPKNKPIFNLRDKLQKKGIDFRKNNGYPIVSSYFDVGRNKGGYPLYYHGLFSTNESPIEKAFEAFMKHIKNMGKSCNSGFNDESPSVVIMLSPQNFPTLKKYFEIEKREYYYYDVP